MKAKERYTYKDLCSWPEGERWELIDGEAFAMSPAPKRNHQKVVGKLFAQLEAFFDGKPCEPYISPLDVYLPNKDWKGDTLEDISDVVQPDLAVVCDPGKLIDEGILGAPDFIIEILSPSSAYRDLTEKRKLYETYAVREYWVVNPDTLELQIYSLSGAAYGLPRAANLENPVPVGIFDGLSLRIAP